MARFAIKRRESPEKKLSYPHFEISSKYHILPTPAAVAELRKQGRETNKTTVSMNSAVLQGQIMLNTTRLGKTGREKESRNKHQGIEGIPQIKIGIT